MTPADSALARAEYDVRVARKKLAAAEVEDRRAKRTLAGLKEMLEEAKNGS